MRLGSLLPLVTQPEGVKMPPSHANQEYHKLRPQNILEQGRGATVLIDSTNTEHLLRARI